MHFLLFFATIPKTKQTYKTNKTYKTYNTTKPTKLQKHKTHEATKPTIPQNQQNHKTNKSTNPTKHWSNQMMLCGQFSSRCVRNVLGARQLCLMCILWQQKRLIHLCESSPNALNKKADLSCFAWSWALFLPCSITASLTCSWLVPPFLRSMPRRPPNSQGLPPQWLPSDPAQSPQPGDQMLTYWFCFTGAKYIFVLQ